MCFLAEQAAKNLARGRLRDLLDDLDPAHPLVGGDALGDEGDHLVGVSRPGRDDDEGLGTLRPPRPGFLSRRRR